METEDPWAALGAASVSQRCAGARDLSRAGTWDDLDRLVALAWEERSLSVRLATAAAAADIAARARPILDRARRDQVVAWAFREDPGVNAAMLMLAAAAPTPAVLTRLGRICRDPRREVRIGAITALRRTALSVAAPEEGLEEVVRLGLLDGRVPGDTKADLVSLVGEAGLEGCRDLVARLGPGVWEEAVARALDRLDARARPDAWAGAWTSDGRDIFAPLPPGGAAPLRVALVTADGPAQWVEGEQVLALQREGADVARDGVRLRLLWARPLGADAPAAVIVDGRAAWWQAGADAVRAQVEADPDAARAWPDAAREALATALADAGDAESAAIAAWLRGAPAAALSALAPLLDRARPKVVLSYWAGRCHAELGDVAAAAEHLARFVERARASDPLRASAKRLLREA